MALNDLQKGATAKERILRRASDLEQEKKTLPGSTARDRIMARAVVTERQKQLQAQQKFEAERFDAFNDMAVKNDVNAVRNFGVMQDFTSRHAATSQEDRGGGFGQVRHGGYGYVDGQYTEPEKKQMSYETAVQPRSTEDIDTELAQARTDNEKAAAELERYTVNAPAGVAPDALMKAQEEARAKLETSNKRIEELVAEKQNTEQYNKLVERAKKDRKDTFSGQWSANQTMGRLSQDLNAAYDEYLTNPTEINRAQTERLERLAEAFAKNNSTLLDDEGAIAPWLTQTAAGYIPQLVDQTKAQVVGGVVGGLVGSSVPVLGTAAGIKAGATAASGVYSFGQMRGAAYRELLAAGVDENTAASLARDEAFISALIEMADTGIDMATLGTGKLISTIFGEGVEKIAKTAAGSAVKKAITTIGKYTSKLPVRYALNVLGEGIEEGAQQAVSIANRERAAQGEKGAGNLAGNAIKTAWNAATNKDGEARAEIAEAASEGMKIAAMFGGATALGTAVANGNLQNSLQRAKERAAENRQRAAESAFEIARENARQEVPMQQEPPAAVQQGANNEAARQTQTAESNAKENAPDLSAYPALQKFMETGVMEDAAAVATEAVNAVNDGVLRYEDGKSINRQALVQERESARQVQQKDPGFYGEASEADRKYLDRLSKAAGVSIERVAAAQAGQREGWIIGGRVYLSEETTDPLRMVAKHEVTHYLQELAADSYHAFRGYVENIYRERGTLEAQLEGLKNLYRQNEQELTDEEALDELAANFAGELMDNEALIRRLAGEDRNLAQKILDAIRDILRRLRTALGSKEVKQLEQAAKLWEQALEETNRAYYQEGRRSKAGERDMIKKTDNNRAVAVVESDILSHIDTTAWDKTKQDQAKKAAKTALLAFKDGVRVNGITYKVNKVSRDEFTRSNETERLYKKQPEAFADKLRAAQNVDDVIVATTYWANDGGLKHPRKDNFVDFTRGEVLIQAGNNQYKAETVVGITDAGEYVFYDVIDMEPTEFTIKEEPSTAATGQTSESAIQESSSEYTVPQERRSVKGARKLQKMIDSGALKTYEQITDAQNSLYQQERELADRKRAAVNNPELMKAMDEYSGMFNEMRELLPKRRNKTATQAELDRIEEIKTLREEKMAEIVDLQEQLGLKEIEEEETAIRETKEQLRVAADEAWEREGAEKEDEAIAKAGLSSADYFRKKALKAFKTTTNFNEAGYLLPDGKMLNFSGGERNHRYRDHREIGEIYEATNGVKALNRFLADGNIRIMAESPGIDLAAGVEPTYEQYAVLKKFINSNGKKEGEFFVDFSSKDGRREGNYSYTNGVNADRIINDIKYYYETGKIREQSAVSMFHERDSVKGARELQKQIDRLERQNKRLQEQMKRTDVPKANRKAVEQQANELRKAYSSRMDKTELADWLEKLYQGMAAQSGRPDLANGYAPSWAEIREESRAIAEAILAESRGNINPIAEEYSQLRKDLRNTRMSLSPEYRADLENAGGYEAVRKQNMGSFILANDAPSVDTVYDQLSEKHPELFPDDIFSPADQLLRIAQVAKDLKQVEGNPFAQDMEQTAAYLAGEIEERFYDTPQEAPTAMDKAERRYHEQRIRDQQVNAAKLRQREAEFNRKLQEMEEQYREENRRRIANQSASERRETIYRHANRLGKKLVQPTDKQHVPEEMRGAALAMVTYLNLESGYELAYGKDAKYHRVEPGTELGAEITSRTAAARALQAEYRRLAEEDTSLTIDPDMDDYLDEIARMGNRKLTDMTRAELDTVWRAMQVIEHTINQADDLLAESRYKTVSQMANALREENGGKEDRTDWAGGIGRADKLLNLDMLTPETFFHRMGKAGEDIFRQMRRAADRQTVILKEGTDRAAKLIKESGVSFEKADKTLHTFDLDGGQLTLSTGQIMELYALSKREQALEHIYKGGLKPVDATLKGKLVGVSQPVKVTPADVAEIISELSDKERALVDGLQKYMSGDLARHGNQESRKVYGYDKFREKNYWPIKVSSAQVASDPTKAAGAKTIPGYGMTKALTPKANNAVELRSAIDTYSRHLNQMATYAAWLGTNENITKLQNFTYMTEDGQKDGTVKELFEKVYGRNGNQYVENLLSDIAQGTKAGADKSIAEMGLSRFKAAKVGGNLRVIIQQPTAILRAMEMVNPKYFVAAKNPVKGWERAKEYSPIAQWKDWGYFEMDTGRSLRELAAGTENKLDKAKNALMAPAGLADSVAWGHLWNAVENEVADQHGELEKGSKAFYEAVAERFGEVVDRTQVVDTVLHRTQIMRSSNYLNKVSTSFMSEPMKVYNMVVRNFYDLRNAGSDEAKKRAGKQLARTSASLIVSFAVNALAQSIVDGLRDDDREKKYLDKVADQWAENFAENFNPIGYIPVAKDVLSLVQGYTLERSEMEGVAELITSMRQLSKATRGESQKTVLAAGLEAASKLGDLLGLPVSNLKRDAEAIVRTAMIEAGASKALYEWDKKVYSPEKAMSKFYDDLYRAMDTDQGTYELIYDELLAQLQEQDGLTEEEAAAKIRTNMENRMKKSLGLEKTSSLPVRYSAPGEDEVFDKMLEEAMAADGDWAEAVDEETLEMARQMDGMDSDSTKVQRVAEIGTAPFGEDVREQALENVLSDKEWEQYRAAKAGGVSLYDWCDYYESVKAEHILRTGKAGSESQEDAEAVLNRMQLTDEQRTAIWNSYGWKKESQWS